jgi:tetratricopeptide (TPR) repeat protein
MGRLSRAPLPPGPTKALFDELHELHHRAGWPPLRTIARDVGCSHTTVASAFAGPAVPRWGLLELIVRTLGGSVLEFHELWLATGVELFADDLPDAVPTPRRDIPRQLPADVGGFIGRDAALEALDEVLAAPAGVGRPRLAVVSGTAGVGKTATVLHWGHRVAHRFSDGQLFVDLRGYDPDQPLAVDQVQERVLRALLPADVIIPRQADERSAYYRTQLADRKLLLVLDNARSTAQVRDLLPGTGACVVVVTSRDGLPGLVARHGARRVELGLLAVDESVDLLRTLVGHRVDIEPQAARGLVAQCAQLPLALRIAAELAASRPTSQLADLHARLADTARRLDLLAAGDDERTAIRAVFSWSTRSLPAAQDRMFQLLGLAPATGVDAATAAALAEAAEPEAEQLLVGLRLAHLVEEQRPGVYAMHGLLRSYSLEQAAGLADADRRAATARLTSHYVLTAAGAARELDAKPAQRAGIEINHWPAPDARAWLDRERATLLTIAAETPEAAGPLSRALGDYLDAGGHYSEALTLHEAALSAARAGGDRMSEAISLNRLGVVRRRLGDYRAAAQHHRAVLDLLVPGDDPAVRATALHGLGIVLWRTGEYTDALELLGRALREWDAAGDRASGAAALYAIGTVHLHLGNYREAIAHHERALELYQASGDALGEGRVHNNLGAAFERVGRLEEARQHLQRSMTLSRQVGNRLGVAVAHTNLGSVCTRLGEFDRGLEHHATALATYRRMGYRVGVADAMVGLGTTYLRMGRRRDAHDHFTEALDVATGVGESEAQIGALLGLGDTATARGDFATAQQHFDEALERATSTGDRYGSAAAHLGLARMNLRRHDSRQAAEEARRAQQLFVELELPEAREAERLVGQATRR